MKFLILTLAILLTLRTSQAQQLVPIVSFSIDTLQLAHFTVESTTADYFVLEAQNTGDTEYHTVGFSVGQVDSTTLIDNLPALQRSQYRIRKFARNNQGDSDHDGRPDLDEVAAIPVSSPFNTGNLIQPTDGAVWIADSLAFESIAERSEGIFSYYAGSVFTKVYLVDNASDNVGLYFLNANSHETHLEFAESVGIPTQSNGLNPPEDMRGSIVYHPEVVASNGMRGLFTYNFRSFDEFDFEIIQRTHDKLASNMPFLQGNLAYRPLHEIAIEAYGRERHKYDASRISVVSEDELLGDLTYLGLNQKVGFGRLTIGTPGDRPSPFDIVIYDVPPNELPRVGGIITNVLQTPLSHVNLRAIQDEVPNAFVKDARTDARFVPFLDTYVRLEVRADTFLIRTATLAEVNSHFEGLRPEESLVLVHDLSVEEIRPLDNLRYFDAVSVGAKAANLAELRRLDFQTTKVPNGYAIPFAFYVDFMRENGLDSRVEAMLKDAAFRQNFEEQDRQLKALRDAIKDGDFSQERYDQLTELQESFPQGTHIRCRSSTNSEDLPGFSGAGLYDSKTQRPDEGHISKSIKQVFASLWNFRAFVERDFYKIDQLSAAMAVLVHPNFRDEQVNGVAVTIDPIYENPDRYYANVTLGETSVTNPTGQITPEEILLDQNFSGDMGGFYIVRRSSQVPFGERVLGLPYINELRDRLRTIHQHFAAIYEAEDDPTFAMEIEFKVDRGGFLSIKQARPWAGYTPLKAIETPDTSTQVNAIVFPNPSKGSITFQVGNHAECTYYLHVYTVAGVLIQEQVWPAVGPMEQVEWRSTEINLSSGCYFYRLKVCDQEFRGLLLRE